MPVVPRLDRPQIQEQALPNARVTTNAPAEMFNGGAASGAEGVKVVSGFIQKEQEKADNTASQELYVELVKKKNDLMYHPTNGALARQGKDALGAAEEYSTKFDDMANEIEAKATSPAQREMFQKMRAKEGLELNTSLEKHTFGELEKYQDHTYQSMISTLHDDTVKNFSTDPDKIQSNLDLSKSAALEHAKRKGYDGTQTKALLTDIESQTHSSVMQSLLSKGDDLAAKAYYDKTKSSLSAKDGIHMEKILEEGSTRGESQRQADEITSKAGSLKTAYDEAREIENPKVREATIQRIKEHFTIKESSDQMQREGMTRNAFQSLEQSKGLKMPSESVWLSLDNNQRKAIEERRDQLISGRPAHTDMSVWYGLEKMAVDPVDRDKFAKMDLMLVRPKLSDSDFQGIVKLQTSLRNGKEDDALDGLRTKHEILNSAMTAAGIDFTPKPGTADSKKVDDFRATIDAEVRQIQKETGKVVGREQLESIARKHLIEVKVKGGWLWDSSKKLSEVKPDEQVYVKYDDVPPTERAKIEAAIKSHGMKPDEKAVAELYMRKLRGKK
jgi:hypothetical protein